MYTYVAFVSGNPLGFHTPYSHTEQKIALTSSSCSLLQKLHGKIQLGSHFSFVPGALTKAIPHKSSQRT